MNSVRRPLLPRWLCAVLAIPAIVAGGWLGLRAGEALGYGIAALTDRDIAELKDMLIWSIAAGGASGGVAAFWLVLWLARAGRYAERSALILLGFVAVAGTGLMLSAFDWPKSSGTPVVDYELRLPAGLPLPDNVDLTVWSEGSGQGCYIKQIRKAGERPEIAGSLVLQTNNLSPRMSLRLNRRAEGYWRLPLAPDAPLDKAFGPWQRIEFIATPREDVPPLPTGDYDIRYRVRKYM